MKGNIALIGFMGTGKSEIGKELARISGKRYVSTDSLVEEKARKSIEEIFEEEGEGKFRELESEVVREISTKSNMVIDCGGGIVLNEENIEALKESGVIICLTSSPEIIVRRIKKGNERPLLEVPNKLEKIKELMSFREKFYKKATPHCIDTSDLAKGEVVEKILKIVNQND